MGPTRTATGAWHASPSLSSVARQVAPASSRLSEVECHSNRQYVSTSQACRLRIGVETRLEVRQLSAGNRANVLPSGLVAQDDREAQSV
jgi:hypothetical protein